MTLTQLNQLPPVTRTEALATCCGAAAWVDAINASFPVPNEQTLFDKASSIWYGLTKPDWLEAFTHHPKIGDVNALAAKFASTSAWAMGEQGAVKQASIEVIEALAEGNRQYEDKFGYIFIVCATGKTAEQMLALLQQRLPNAPDMEIHLAMA